MVSRQVCVSYPSLKLLATSIVTSTVVWQHQAIRIKKDGTDIQSAYKLRRRNMKIRMCCMTVLMLACSVSLFAQTPMSGDSSMKKSDAMGEQMTITGCIAEKDGKYILKNKKHPDGVELIVPMISNRMSATRSA
jgi:hypothetical protein